MAAKPFGKASVASKPFSELKFECLFISFYCHSASILRINSSFSMSNSDDPSKSSSLNATGGFLAFGAA